MNGFLGNYTYISVDKLQNEFPDLDPEEIQETINLVGQLVDKLTDDHFGPIEKTIYCSGSGTVRQNFYPEEKLRCLSVESVRDTDSLEVVPQPVYRVYPRFMILVEVVTTARRRFSEVWPKGVRNLEIKGVFGWAECPKAIERAAFLLAVQLMKAPKKSALGQLLSSERIGDYSYSVDRGSQQEKKVFETGISEVDFTIRNYRNRPILMSVV